MDQIRKYSVRVAIAFSAVLLMMMSGVASAHGPIGVPPPTGPRNTYYAENGAWGVFCANGYIELVHLSGGSFRSYGETITKSSGSGLCADLLPLDANHIYLGLTLRRSDGAVCSVRTQWNSGSAAGVLFSTPASGGACAGQTVRTDATHQTYMYTYDSLVWSTPYH